MTKTEENNIFILKKQFATMKKGVSEAIIMLVFVIIAAILLQELVFDSISVDPLILGVVFIFAIIVEYYIRLTCEPYDLQQQDLIINLPYDDTFDLCMRSLQLFSFTVIVNSDRQSGVIEAHQKSRFDEIISWPIIIRFSIKTVGREKTRVIVTSNSVSRWILTFGRNAKNIRKIHAFLLQQSQDRMSGIT